MSIKGKIISIFILMILALGLAVTLSAGFILMREVNQNEETNSRRETHRVTNAFQRELFDLQRVTRDYSGWDDTYQYMVDKNQKFIDSNMSDATFSQNRVNLLFILNLEGEILFQKAFDLQADQEISPPPALVDFVSSTVLRESTLKEDYVAGFVVLGTEMFLLASSPILNSQFEGPPRGVMIFGRCLDSWMVDYIGQITDEKITLFPFHSLDIPETIRKRFQESSEPNPTSIEKISSTLLRGYGLLRDGFQKPSLVICVELPRIYRLHAIQNMGFLLGFILLLSIFGVLLTWILLDRLVLKRLADLHRFVQTLGPSQDLTSRYQCRGNDELSHLGRVINHLLDRLSQYLEERLQVETNLRLSEVKYRTIVENINDALIIHDFQSQILDVNDHACSLLNQLRENLVGKNLLLFELRQEEKIFSTISNQLAFSDTTFFDCGYQISNEDRIYIEVNAKVVSREGNGIIHSFIRDITERKVYEENLSQAHKMEVIGQLAGGIAHDFNNLLTGILGYADLMKKNTESGTFFDNAANVIKKTASRAAELTRQLLGFSRRGKLQLQPVNVNGIINEVIQLLERTIDKKIILRKETVSESLYVQGDPGQIQQILLNLAINARDAICDGGTITFSTNLVYIDGDYCRTHLELEENFYVVISVEDTGCGIPEEIQQRIFEPFFTTKAVGKGTGMGLAMVYGIVKNHGGSIHVYSEVGLGTVFKLYFPQYKVEKLTEPESKSTHSVNGSGHILLIDDEISVLECVEEMLKGMGYQVIAFNRGKEGIEYYKTHSQEIDIVLLDMIMPEINGTECFLELKNINPDVQVIISSGFTFNEKTQELLDRGLSGFLNKPFSISELSKILNTVMNK